MSSIHRGAILHRIAKLHKKSIVQISKDAGVDQSTFYYHKEQEDLSFEILYKYAIAMDYFFSTELPEFSEWLKENNLLPSDEAQLSIEGLLKERDYWKDKYYSLLEEHNNLIKEKYLKGK
ncbi:hypothetical protein [Sphingobacterium psychroaquaticum]|uniref:Uncharacterized protein n=1 Tax=Sphingobacterium psychroaquaticum TaxID=561061 RepID=A0A1X7ILD9_9SPHI|nr:hypothetical protein [Sphingobacterium psychroaquaticum]SMG15748.1 hypothetical protein SAMN05660862_0999 [Sphingobacterium psychroaquaticum]